jgi:hypothetical protein
LTAESAGTPPRRHGRRIAALVVLVVGIAALATTVSTVKKEPVAIHVVLPGGIRGLRLDVERRDAAGDKLIEHLEWSYRQASPPSQDTSIELPPGHYAVTLHPLGWDRGYSTPC